MFSTFTIQPFLQLESHSILSVHHQSQEEPTYYSISITILIIMRRLYSTGGVGLCLSNDEK